MKLSDKQNTKRFRESLGHREEDRPLETRSILKDRKEVKVRSKR